MNRRILLSALAFVALAGSAWMALSSRTPIGTFTISVPAEKQPSSQSLEQDIRFRAWYSVEDFDKNVSVFESVFWDPRDTTSLRQLIRSEPWFNGKTVLEIGTGSGLLALCCLEANAKYVVVTDVNESAIANASFNACLLGHAERIETRRVPLDDTAAYSVIGPEERFDLILSNPPWVNRQPTSIDQYALYDANFDLMKSMFDGFETHLNPGGRVLLAYGCVDAIKSLEKLANEHGYGFIVHDDRDLDELPEEFLPGMLVEIKVYED